MITTLLVVFAVLLAIGTPIAIAMAGSAILLFWADGISAHCRRANLQDGFVRESVSPRPSHRRSDLPGHVFGIAVAEQLRLGPFA